jgi:hypothetical protein
MHLLGGGYLCYKSLQLLDKKKPSSLTTPAWTALVASLQNEELIEDCFNNSICSRCFQRVTSKAI